jgi:hypothetical protein
LPTKSVRRCAIFFISYSELSIRQKYGEVRSFKIP